LIALGQADASEATNPQLSSKDQAAADVSHIGKGLVWQGQHKEEARNTGETMTSSSLSDFGRAKL
jgi:hypothetical protein